MDGIGSIIEQLEKQREAFDRALSALREIGPVTEPSTATNHGTTVAESPKRTFSAATRRKMALAQQRRYAALRGENVAGNSEVPAEETKATKPAKRTLSPEGLANIRAAVKRRWVMAKKAAAAK